MTSQYKSEDKGYGQGVCRSLARRLKGLEAKVDEILVRMDEQRHLLQEILDNTGRDNGHGTDWYDLYDESGYD
jgi:hypothetical protein